MSTPRRVGNLGNGLSSSQLTQDRSTRAVYSNFLAQRTRVQLGQRPFIVYQGGTVGQGGPVNLYSIAEKTGAITLTEAQQAAAIASATPS